MQGHLTNAARRLLGPATRVVGASRTDAGVHALGQVASVATESALSATAVQGALNAMLPADIRVLRVGDADAGFDARRHARRKRYAYLIDNGAVASPLLRRYAWHVRVSLDVSAMRAGLGRLRGVHDFSAFRAAPGRSQHPVCHVSALHVVQHRLRLAIVVSADRYMHHMVRNIVGSADTPVGLDGRRARQSGSDHGRPDGARPGPDAAARPVLMAGLLGRQHC